MAQSYVAVHQILTGNNRSIKPGEKVTDVSADEITELLSLGAIAAVAAPAAAESAQVDDDTAKPAKPAKPAKAKNAPADAGDDTVDPFAGE